MEGGAGEGGGVGDARGRGDGCLRRMPRARGDCGATRVVPFAAKFHIARSATFDALSIWYHAASPDVRSARFRLHQKAIEGRGGKSLTLE